MVHASLKAIGAGRRRSGDGRCRVTLRGWADWHCDGIRVVGPITLQGSPNGARLDDKARRTWPPFDPATAGTYRGFGLLNQFLVQAPARRRSAHPDASMVAVGPLAETLTEPHELGHAWGKGRPSSGSSALAGRPCCWVRR